MDVENARDFAQGLFLGAGLVAKHMQEVNNSLVGTLINPSTRDECMRGMFLRAIAWMKTLEKLNQPTDFQAIVSCNRAFLEITVDIVLLHKDASDSSAWKMHWWEQSSKLKWAEGVETYYSLLGQQVPEEQGQFIRNNKQLTERMRMALWPKGKHPRSNRWTGNWLLQDIKAADGYWGRAIKG